MEIKIPGKAVFMSQWVLITPVVPFGFGHNWLVKVAIIVTGITLALVQCSDIALTSSQIMWNSTVCSTVWSGSQSVKHQRFHNYWPLVRGIHNPFITAAGFPHKGPVRQKAWSISWRHHELGSASGWDIFPSKTGCLLAVTRIALGLVTGPSGNTNHIQPTVHFIINTNMELSCHAGQEHPHGLHWKQLDWLSQVWDSPF